MREISRRRGASHRAIHRVQALGPEAVLRLLEDAGRSCPRPRARRPPPGSPPRRAGRAGSRGASCAAANTTENRRLRGRRLRNRTDSPADLPELPPLLDHQRPADDGEDGRGATRTNFAIGAALRTSSGPLESSDPLPGTRSSFFRVARTNRESRFRMIQKGPETCQSIDTGSSAPYKLAKGFSCSSARSRRSTRPTPPYSAGGGEAGPARHDVPLARPRSPSRSARSPSAGTGS